jgi:hypothetical protein
MTKKVINNPKKEEDKMSHSKATSNVLLSLIALILGVIAFNAAEANKDQKMAMQGLSTLVSKHYGHAMAVNLTNEGRRSEIEAAAVGRMVSQLVITKLSGEEIEFGKALAIKTYSPEAEKIVSEIEAAGLSGETTEFGKALAIKTYSPATMSGIRRYEHTKRLQNKATPDGEGELLKYLRALAHDLSQHSINYSQMKPKVITKSN